MANEMFVERGILNSAGISTGSSGEAGEGDGAALVSGWAGLEPGGGRG